MKYSHVVFFTSLFLVFFFCSSSIASELLAIDVTVKNHERKALLQLTNIGLNTDSVSLSVNYCSLEAKKCQKKKPWRYFIDQSLEDRMSLELLKQLDGKRYDTIKIMNNKISIKSIFDTIEVNSDVEGFYYGAGNESDFKISVSNYLNKKISPLMLRLLDKAKDVRYKEMSDKEKETFLTAIAKEESVPMRFIQKLMNSAYVFSFHVDNIKGYVDIRRREGENEAGNKYLYFSTSVFVKLKFKLIIYNFNADKKQFQNYSTVRGAEISSTFISFSDKYPKHESTVKGFNSAYVKAAKKAGKSINLRLKLDENFAIFATVDQVEGSRLKSKIGEIEDLRIDAPYRIYQFIDGERIQTGWMKARSVASEITYKEDAANYYSNFDLIRGNAEIKDQVKEESWWGGFIFYGVSRHTLTVDEIDNERVTGGGSYLGLNVGVKVDMGYTSNSKKLSEQWAEFYINYGFSGGEDIVFNNILYENTYTLNVGLDIVQRKILKYYGLYWGYKYGFGFSGLSGTDSNDNQLNIAAGVLDLGMQIGFMASPKSEYFINLDLKYPVITSAAITADGADESGPSMDARLSHMIGMTIGTTF